MKNTKFVTVLYVLALGSLSNISAYANLEKINTELFNSIAISNMGHDLNKSINNFLEYGMNMEEGQSELQENNAPVSEPKNKMTPEEEKIIQENKPSVLIYKFLEYIKQHFFKK